MRFILFATFLFAFLGAAFSLPQPNVENSKQAVSQSVSRTVNIHGSNNEAGSFVEATGVQVAAPLMDIVKGLGVPIAALSSGKQTGNASG